MNPFALGWFWQGLRGHSITFSALFASLVLGVSIAGGVGRLLSSLGVHWLYVIILPAVLFWWLNRKEAQWVPDLRMRKWIARSLLFGSIVAAVIIARLRAG